MRRIVTGVAIVALVVAGAARVYGKWTGLSVEHRHEGRDLAVTTDVRNVFGECHAAQGVADARPVFPGYALSPSEIPRGCSPGVR